MSYEYDTIEKAIHYLNVHFKEQPDLDTVAAEMNISPHHFQRMFTAWAGVSPKKFSQFLTLGYAKSLLRERQHTLFDTALESGLSGTGRLHDLFISMEGMSPAEYKHGAPALAIGFSYQQTHFGEILVASTPRGICHLAFCNDRDEALKVLTANFPQAIITSFQHAGHLKVKNLFLGEGTEPLRLHLKGTPFQLKVWEALLKIPSGSVSTYSGLASAVGHTQAARAVGSAVGANPVACLIPCHRVIRSTGILGEYHWGTKRKQAMIAWEAAQKTLT